MQLQRLTDEQYHQYVHALQVAEEPAKPATGTWQLAEPHDQTAAAPRPQPHPLLRIHTSSAEADSDPGSPYPALLASVGVTPTTVPKTSQNTPATETAEEAETGGAGPASDDAGAAPSAASIGTHQDKPGSEGSGEEPQTPEIAVLGPLAVSGVTTSGHGPKVAALAALIHLRPGRSAEYLCTAMDPVNPWSTRTLQSRLSELRSRLGTAPDGRPYLPRPTHGYRFHPDVTSDWQRFQHLATRGLADPDAGTADLESALYLLRGKPFEGRDFAWADAVQQEMISRVVDTAHTLAVRHTEGDHPDLDAARRAALRGLEIDETSEVLYRDWMNIEWGPGTPQESARPSPASSRSPGPTTSPSIPLPNSSSTWSCRTGLHPHAQGRTETSSLEAASRRPAHAYGLSRAIPPQSSQIRGEEVRGAAGEQHQHESDSGNRRPGEQPAERDTGPGQRVTERARPSRTSSRPTSATPALQQHPAVQMPGQRSCRVIHSRWA